MGILCSHMTLWSLLWEHHLKGPVEAWQAQDPHLVQFLETLLSCCGFDTLTCSHASVTCGDRLFPGFVNLASWLSQFFSVSSLFIVRATTYLLYPSRHGNPLSC